MARKADSPDGLKKRLDAMLKKPENQVCADCPTKQPRWASSKLGVFICIDCSGIHRNLGTHISFVRSVNLDSWTVQQVQMMEQWGNARAKAYFEAEVPSSYRMPFEGAGVREVQKWIRDKYEHKRFVPQNGSVPQAGAPKAPPAALKPAALSARAPTPATAPRAHTAAPPPAPPAPAPALDLLDFSDPSPPAAQPAPAAPAAPPVASPDPFFQQATAQWPQQAQSTAPQQAPKVDIMAMFNAPGGGYQQSMGGGMMGIQQMGSPPQGYPPQPQGFPPQQGFQPHPQGFPPQPQAMYTQQQGFPPQQQAMYAQQQAMYAQQQQQQQQLQMLQMQRQQQMGTNGGGMMMGMQPSAPQGYPQQQQQQTGGIIMGAQHSGMAIGGYSNAPQQATQPPAQASQGFSTAFNGL